MSSFSFAPELILTCSNTSNIIQKLPCCTVFHEHTAWQFYFSTQYHYYINTICVFYLHIYILVINISTQLYTDNMWITGILSTTIHSRHNRFSNIQMGRANHSIVANHPQHKAGQHNHRHRYPRIGAEEACCRHHDPPQEHGEKPQ